VHCTLFGLTSVVYKSSSSLIRLLVSFISRFCGSNIDFLLDTGDPTVDGAAVALGSFVSSGSEIVSFEDNEGEVIVLALTRVEVASVSSRRYCDAIEGDIEVLALGATVNSMLSGGAAFEGIIEWQFSRCLSNKMLAYLAAVPAGYSTTQLQRRQVWRSMHVLSKRS
jgi:hypothetical protein